MKLLHLPSSVPVAWCSWAISLTIIGVPTAAAWVSVPLSDIITSPTLPFAGVERPIASAELTTAIPAATYSSRTRSSALQDGVTQWLSAATAATATMTTTTTVVAVEPPSKADILLLRSAFAEFYGVNRDLPKAQDLLSQTITKWQQQPADEQAGLYRVRGDCHMLLLNADAALQDYDQAVQLLEKDLAGPANADPQELPASLLGRARAAKVLALEQKDNPQQQRQWAARAAGDYRRALQLGSREDWDTDAELLEDGATRNPYAAWEHGDALRLSGRYREAAAAHALASTAFDAIGDPARSVISLLDCGINLASSSDPQDAAEAETVLTKAIPKTKGIRGTDLDLLRRVVSKEGEGRMALAATLWTESSKRPQAEKTMGDACLRLEQLQAQLDAAVAAAQKNSGKQPVSTASDAPRLLYSIDDDERGVGPLFDCSKFRNPKFVKDTLGWPESLQAKVTKLETLR